MKFNFNLYFNTKNNLFNNKNKNKQTKAPN